MSKHKPCPKCGSLIPVAVEFPAPASGVIYIWFIYCESCHYQGEVAETEAEAWEAWDRRRYEA
jgi:Lar family restriction alleviation protein